MLLEITAETCKIYNLFKNCGFKIKFEVFWGIYFHQVDGSGFSKVYFVFPFESSLIR
jgi:hypothetical protein